MEYLTISFIAKNQNTVINQLIYLTAKNNCHIEESRFALLGNDFAGIMRASGNWDAIAKLETAIANLTDKKDKSDIVLELKRNESFKAGGDYLPYLAQVVALNTVGLVHEISEFFTNQSIQIIDLQTDPFKASHSNTAMMTLSTRINIPPNINIADLRERFMMLCDELNVDGIMEPEKR
jgi:glycine cleavage system transcriptional repressor